MSWLGNENARSGQNGPDFVIEAHGIGQRRRAVLYARRRDGTLRELARHPNFGLVARLQRQWRAKLRAGDAVALELVDVSAGQLRGPDR